MQTAEPGTNHELSVGHQVAVAQLGQVVFNGRVEEILGRRLIKIRDNRGWKRKLFLDTNTGRWQNFWTDMDGTIRFDPNSPGYEIWRVETT